LFFNNVRIPGITIPISLVIVYLHIAGYISVETAIGTFNSGSSNSGNGQTNIDNLYASEIATNISVMPESTDEGFLYLSAFSINDKEIQYTRNLNDELAPFQLTSWNQTLQLSANYKDYRQEHDQNLTNLLIGHIGNFSNFDSLLEEANWYEEIPLGSKITIELPNESVSFMLAEEKVSANMSAIYYGIFDGNQNAFENKQSSLVNSDSRIMEINSLSPSQLNKNGSLYNVTYELVCNDLSKFSYDTCN
jgi:hypothetical protein